MQTIKDDRRTVYVHPGATESDLPLDGELNLLPVAREGSFVPNRMEEPRIYPGDVIVGVKDDDVWFAELIMYRQDSFDTTGIMVQALTSTLPTLIPDSVFSARFFQADRIHIFEGIGEEAAAPELTYDTGKLETPVEGQPR